MPQGENAGAVYVVIDGDNSPLLAKFQQSEAASRAAGQRIAGALGNGFQQASGLVDQFGRAIQSSVTKPVEAAVPEVNALAQAGQRLALALGEVAGASEATAAGLGGVGAAADKGAQKVQSFVGVIPGLGRAAEHFINLIPGLGTAIMAAFPVLGAIALIENLKSMATAVYKAAENFLFLRDAEEEALNVGKQLASETKNAVQHIQDMQVQALREQGHLVQAAQMAAANNAKRFIELPRPDMKNLSGLTDSQQRQVRDSFANVLPEDLPDRIKRIQSGIGSLGDELEVLSKNKSGPLDFISQHFISQDKRTMELMSNALATLMKKQDEFAQSTQNSAIDVAHAKEEEADRVQAAADKAAAALQKQVSNFEKSYDRMTAIAERAQNPLEQHNVAGLAVRTRELSEANRRGPAYADVAEKAQQQIDSINKKNREVDAEERKRIQDRKKLTLDALEEEGKRQDDLIHQRVKEETEGEREIAAQRKQSARIQEIELRGHSATLQGANQEDRLRAQIEYEQQAVHTGQQQVEYAKQLADLDQKALDIRVGLAQYDLIQAALGGDTIRMAENHAKLEQAIAAAKLGQLRSTLQINDAENRNSLRFRIQQQAGTISSGVGHAAAGAVMDGKHIGAAIRDSLKGVGQQMLGSIFDKLIQQIIVSTGVQALLASVLGVHAGVTVASTVATTANAVSTDVNTVATTANTFWLAIKSFFGGLFAEGGRPPVGVPSIVGERGKELFVPDVPGTIIPNHQLAAAGIGGGSFTTSSSSSALTIGAIHMHGVTNARQMARELPNVLKGVSPRFSPYAAR
jgi:hypothetical protein